MEHSSTSSIIVGVMPGQPDIVVEKACEIAQSIGNTAIHMMYVNATLIEDNGRMEAADPDSFSESWREDSQELSNHVLGIAREHGITADYHIHAGDPAQEIATFTKAQQHALMIVVGTRERGAKAALTEWMNGSVAVRLSHTQSTPVLMVPLADQYDK